MSVRRPMCMLSILFVLGLYLLLTLLGGVDEKEYCSDLKSIYVSGVVEDKVYKNGKYSLHFKKCEMLDEKILDDDILLDSLRREEKNTDGITTIKLRNKQHFRRMIVYLNEQSSFDYRIGQRVIVKGSYNNFSQSENDGQFNMRKYYRIRGYEASITKGIVKAKGSQYSKIKEWLFRIKERTKTIFGYYMEDEAGTLSAMVLGDKSGLDEEVKDLYQAAGISHVLSLSGLHIATVGMCVYSMLYFSGIGILLSSVISSTIMVLYGIMTGISTSTLRALIMFFIALLARNIGRTYDLLSGVCLSSILILFENPYYVFDSGFLMSFLSVIGIAIIYPILNEVFSHESKKRNYIFIERIKQSVLISTSASLGTLPVVISTFYKISRLSVLINIVVVPLMSIILGIGIISAVLGNIFIRIPFCRLIVGVFLNFAGLILKFYDVCCLKISSIPFNTWVIGEKKACRVILYYALTAIVYIFSEHVGKKKTEFGTRERLGIVGIIGAAVLTLTLGSKREYTINVLSVGQGACNVIYGQYVPTMMVDAGSTDVNEVYKYRIKPFLLSKGIDTIDYLFITHPDRDHISGVIELLENDTSDVKVDHIFLSVRNDEIEELAKSKGIDIRFMKAGDSVTNVKNDAEFGVKCLSPNSSDVSRYEDDKNSLGGSNNDANDLSLVLKVDYKKTGRGEDVAFSALFTGDISTDVEKKLVGEDLNEKNENYQKMLLSSDFLSIPHHGSKYSSSEDFLKTVNAKICTISAGKHNSYGHPHKETLERLSKYVPESKVLRTDKCGQITVMREENKTIIKRYINTQ